MIGTAGCGNKIKTTNAASKVELVSVPEKYYDLDKYCKYRIENNEPIKVYNSENVTLFYNKETYDVREYIYNCTSSLIFPVYELYDIETEKILMYCMYVLFYPVKDCNFYDWYLKELKQNNYKVNLSESADYIEGYEVKDYYSLDEIREIEPQIGECLKAANKVKVKTK